MPLTTEQLADLVARTRRPRPTPAGPLPVAGTATTPALGPAVESIPPGEGLPPVEFYREALDRVGLGHILDETVPPYDPDAAGHTVPPLIRLSPEFGIPPRNLGWTDGQGHVLAGDEAAPLPPLMAADTPLPDPTPAFAPAPARRWLISGGLLLAGLTFLGGGLLNLVVPPPAPVVPWVARIGAPTPPPPPTDLPVPPTLSVPTAAPVAAKGAALPAPTTTPIPPTAPLPAALPTYVFKRLAAPPTPTPPPLRRVGSLAPPAYTPAPAPTPPATATPDWRASGNDFSDAIYARSATIHAPTPEPTHPIPPAGW